MTKLQDFLNSPIPQVAGLRVVPKNGDLFGVELECEGRHVDFDQEDRELLRSWKPHHDGSLRDRHGSACEWVFNGPVNYETAIERIGTLFDYFTKRKARLVCSNRTSTHVHFNMADKTAYQLVNMFILFTILEGLLDRYCGEDRAGNLFCLSSRHAEQQLQWIYDACFKNYNFGMREEWRYCSLNVAAISKFGSVEFRGMRGLSKKEEVIDWLGILNEFCDYACYKMKNPVDTIQSISSDGPVGFIQQVFSKKNVDELLKGLNEYDINQSVYEGMRLVQMLAYKVGTEFDQVRLRGRDFWASFKKDQKPELDIDPELIAKGGPIKQARPRGAGIHQAIEVARQQAEARRQQPPQQHDPFVGRDVWQEGIRAHPDRLDEWAAIVGRGRPAKVKVVDPF